MGWMCAPRSVHNARLLPRAQSTTTGSLTRPCFGQIDNRRITDILIPGPSIHDKLPQLFRNTRHRRTMSDKARSRNRSRPQSPKPRFGLFEFVVGAVFCVGFPGFATAIAPVSWLDFSRVDRQVHVQTRTCVFFFIPYHTQVLANVQSVSTAFKQGDLRHRRPGDRKEGREESEGKIVLHGPQGADGESKTISVSVSPASYKSVEAKIQQFLDTPQQTNLSLFTVANWKFGIIFAIPLSLLTILFVVGWTIWLLQAITSPFFNLFRNDTTAPHDESTDHDLQRNLDQEV